MIRLLPLLFLSQALFAQRLAEVDTFTWRNLHFGLTWQDTTLEAGKSYCIHLWAQSTNMDTVIFESPNSGLVNTSLWTVKGTKVTQETPSLRYQTTYLELPPKDTVDIKACFKTAEIDTKFVSLTAKDEDYILMDEWKKKAERNLPPGEYFVEFEFYARPNIGVGEFNPFVLRKRFKIKE